MQRRNSIIFNNILLISIKRIKSIHIGFKKYNNIKTHQRIKINNNKLK